MYFCSVGELLLDYTVLHTKTQYTFIVILVETSNAVIIIQFFIILLLGSNIPFSVYIVTRTEHNGIKTTRKTHASLIISNVQKLTS
jgi:hypothetical protein